MSALQHITDLSQTSRVSGLARHVRFALRSRHRKFNTQIFRFTRRANHLYKFAPSQPTTGRIAIVTDVGHGMRWTRQHFARDGIAGRVDEASERSPSERTRDVAAYGEVVWS
jgi:hypothetical protein